MKHITTYLVEMRVALRDKELSPLPVPSCHRIRWFFPQTPIHACSFRACQI